MTANYFTTADGRVIRGEAVSLPVLAMNYEAGIAEYLGEAQYLRDALEMAHAKGFVPLQYDHRPPPPVHLHVSGQHRVMAVGFSVMTSNGETYHEWIEVPVAAKVIAA